MADRDELLTHRQLQDRLGRRVAGITALATLWLLASDVLIARLIADPVWRTALRTVNALLFIVVVTIVATDLLRRLHQRRQDTTDDEADACAHAQTIAMLLHALVEAIPAVVVVQDLAGRVLVFNSSAERVSGCSAARLMSEGVPDRLDETQRIWLELPAAPLGAAPRTAEEAIETSEGRRSFQITRGPVPVADGRVGANFLIAHDITERVDAQARLQRSEQRYRQLFDANPQPMWVFDRGSLYFLAVNSAAQRQYGYSREEFLAMTIAEIRSAPEMLRLRAMLESAATPESTRLGDYGSWMHRRKDGSTFDVEVASGELDWDDRPSRLVLVHDLSAQRSAERALHAARHEQAQLPQRLLAHDIETARRIAQSLHDELGNALAIARLQLDRLVLSASSVASALPAELVASINASLDDAMRCVRSTLVRLRPPLLDEQGLLAAVRYEIERRSARAGDARIDLVAQPGRAAQRWPKAVEHVAFVVLREAIANAARHAAARRVELAIDGAPRRLELLVRDDGVGIPPAWTAGRPGHFGVVGMLEQTAAIGARLAIDVREGGGTELRFAWSGEAR